MLDYAPQDTVNLGATGNVLMLQVLLACETIFSTKMVDISPCRNDKNER
jgi:hypothetical protein